MQTGGQYTPSNVELGGPWVCPTDPKYTNSTTGCDPCGSNRPNPYWGGPTSLTPLISGTLARTLARMHARGQWQQAVTAGTVSDVARN